MKINNIEVKGNKLAYDINGKHYILETDEQVLKYKNLGYGICDILEYNFKNISEDEYAFINSGNFQITYKNQFEKCIIEYSEEELKIYNNYQEKKLQEKNEIKKVNLKMINPAGETLNIYQIKGETAYATNGKIYGTRLLKEVK